MKKQILWMSFISLSLLLALLSACAPKASPTPTPTPTGAPVSFAGKTIEIIEPSEAGGGGDDFARVVSKVLGPNLPGNPTVIVRNMPGGGGIEAANFAYSAKPDGLTMVNLAGADMLGAALGQAAVKYDPRKMGFITNKTHVTVVYIKAEVVDKPEDIFKPKKGVIFGHTMGGFGVSTFIAMEVLGVPLEKGTLGYSGGSDARRAFLSGETNAGMGGYESYLRQAQLVDMVKTGKALLLFQSGTFDQSGNMIRATQHGLDVVPTIRDLYKSGYGKEPSGEAWNAFKALVGSQGHAYNLLLPPGTPESILRAYWAAFQKVQNDPAFIDVTTKMDGFPMKLNIGEAAQKVFRDAFGLPGDVKSWMRGTLSPKYKISLE